MLCSGTGPTPNGVTDDVDDDVSRFEDLHRRAFRPLTAYALRRSPPEDAADAVAETFLVAWRRLDDVPTPPDEDRLLDDLRAADPVDSDRLPAHDDAAPAALRREITLATTDTPVPRPTRRWLLAAAAMVAVAAVGGAVALTAGSDNNDAGERAATTVPPPDAGAITPGGSSASCVEIYDLQTLRNRETAFAGTVRAVSGDQVTFEVEQWFRGGDGREATLTSSTGGAITPDGGPPLEPGVRLLVAGDGGFAWGCGFTQPYDEALAADWAEAFAG